MEGSKENSKTLKKTLASGSDNQPNSTKKFLGTSGNDLDIEDSLYMPYSIRDVGDRGKMIGFAYKKGCDLQDFEKFKVESEYDAFARDLTAFRRISEILKLNFKGYLGGTSNQIKEKVKEYVKNLNDADIDCLVIAVSTHGTNCGKLEGSDGSIYQIREDLVVPFEKCESLRGKPKIFIIDACRGDKTDGEENSIVKKKNTEKITYVPIKADCLIAYATNEDFVAHQNAGEMSWYTKAVLKAFEINKYCREDVVSVLTHVNAMVADMYVEETYDKQMPSIRSTLRRKLYMLDNIPTKSQKQSSSSDNKLEEENVKLREKVKEYEEHLCTVRDGLNEKLQKKNNLQVTRTMI